MTTQVFDDTYAMTTGVLAAPVPATIPLRVCVRDRLDAQHDVRQRPSIGDRP
ncbi:hypothetical protein ACSDR0_17025 [Streptosporangium sp. G11]|uniref:hypothetical protein n=1 Tax=Streptosporangium sp. G11 TaxID=3436926 RepID=UPI003EBF25F6